MRRELRVEVRRGEVRKRGEVQERTRKKKEEEGRKKKKEEEEENLPCHHLQLLILEFVDDSFLFLSNNTTV